MGPFMGPACGEASNQEDVPMRTNSPRTRRTKKSPNSASRSSSGRRGPKSVNFKSPPRAVFKSSAAARQAVVTCMPLSDKAAAAHVEALSAFQRYEPTEALHSVEPKPVSPPTLQPSLSPTMHLVKNYSIQSLVSLLGDCAELEGLGSRFPSTYPTTSGPLSSIDAVPSHMLGPDDVPSPRSGPVRMGSAPSSRCGSGASERMVLSEQPCRSETPPGGPSAFETSERLRKCLAPRLVRSRCASSAGSSFAGGDTLRRAWAPQAMRPHGSSSASGSSMGTFCFDAAHADNDHTVIETFRAISHRGGSSCNRGGSTPSECSDDEESGELHGVFAIETSASAALQAEPAASMTLVKPVSRRPSAVDLSSLADVGAAPQPAAQAASSPRPAFSFSTFA